MENQQQLKILSANLADLLRAVADFRHARKYATLPEQYAAEKALEITFSRVSKSLSAKQTGTQPR